MTLRDQCAKCPWRDLDMMREDFPETVAHAAEHGGQGFICHTRMGPCDGPTHSGIAKQAVST